MSLTPSAVVPTTEVVSTNINIELLEVTTQDNTRRDSVKPYPQGPWKVVKLSIQNDQKEKDAINLNSLNFKILDMDTHEITISTGGTMGLEMAENKTLSFQTVNPANIVEGYLSYDVPKGLAGFTMEASEIIAGTPIILKIN
ncbi:DUF4352 domain-containing protein [Desulfosporosinus fructosivorans]|uniref:DUF4352 domain-containing protein n=1 Tax=Desulfosporosinus fructosivorans TaxID=2018669 RepID=A0A4Z0R2E7_9FIRM|nr:DUF4352 domain-containing protein [Desulfosporosinus fructosivorans]